MEKKYEDLIARELEQCVLNTIGRMENEDTHRPFHTALLSEEALFWSRFERSFSTSFVQRVIEQISKAAALSGGAEAAENQRSTFVTLSTSQLNAIEDHISGHRTRTALRRANWAFDIDELAAISSSADAVQVRVISDLWWRRDGVENFMSIKTVKPNIDQTAEAKRDLLKLKLANPNANVYYGLYYNPYGELKSDYGWNPPKKIFDFNEDICVLIGKEYWDTLGGAGFYEDLLAIAARVGVDTRQKITAMR